MASTTTIRVDTETHKALVEMSKSSGESLVSTVRAAAEELRRKRFAQQVASELAELRTDPDGWSDYMGEAEGTSVVDGIDK